jgi:hypothetical protein
VAVAKRALQVLTEAMEIAKSVEKDDLCIYSFTRTYGEMLPAKEFIQHMEKSLTMIEDYAGGDLFNRDDREIIKQDRNLSSILMTLNF